jgi:hypothetical protein
MMKADQSKLLGARVTSQEESVMILTALDPDAADMVIYGDTPRVTRF